MTSRPFSHLWSSRRTRFNHMINRFEANSSTNHGILIFDHILMIKQFSGFGLLWQSDQGEYLPLWMWGRSVRIKSEFEIDQPLELGAASRIFSWPFLQPLRENAVWLSTTVLQSSAHSTRRYNIAWYLQEGKRRMEGGIWQWAIWWFSPLGLPSLPTTTSLHCNRGTPICQKSSLQ